MLHCLIFILPGYIVSLLPAKYRLDDFRGLHVLEGRLIVFDIIIADQLVDWEPTFRMFVDQEWDELSSSATHSQEEQRELTVFASTSPSVLPTYSLPRIKC